MPSYKSLLVLALAASTVTPVLAAEAGTQYFKKNEGRASSHLELVERADPVPLLGAPEPAAPAPPKKGFKLGWKMKTFIGTAAVINGLYAWVLVKNYQAKKAAGNHRNSTTPLNSATPPSNDTSYIRNQPPPGYQPNDNYQEPSTNAYQQNYEGSSTNANQQTYEEQSTSPPQTSTSQSNRPWTNNGPNFRREERPRGRRSPVDILKARSLSDNVRRTPSHLDLLSRADLGEALGLFSRMLDKLD